MYGHVITKFSRMGRFTYPWCSAGALRAPELRYYVTSSIEKDVERLIEDLDKAFPKYRGAYHIGSKSKISEARKRKEQRKKIKEQEIERFK